MEREEEKPGALEGIRIMDFTQVVAGPYCTRFLADMGAEVIKVEPPSGEGTRYWPTLRGGVSGSFLQYNGGKKSLAIDLKKEEARKLIKELVRSCDVVVENFAVGTMNNLGLSYDVLRSENEKIIMCSISGYGQTGPNKNRLGFAATVQADVGLTEMLRKCYPVDVPPAPHALSFADTIAGYHATAAIATALFYRDRTGIGQYIDISMYDSLLFSVDHHVQHYLMSQTAPRSAFGSEPIKGKHGQYIVVGFGKHEMVVRLLKLMGHEDLLSDERFSSLTGIHTYREDFFGLIREWIQKFDSMDDVTEILTRAGLPAGTVHTLVEAVEAPQVSARNMVVEREHPRIGKVRVMNTPIKFSECSSEMRSLAPELGEHNEYVMKDILHRSSEEITSLYEQGVLYQHR